MTSEAIVKVEGTTVLSKLLSELHERAQEHIVDARARNTRKAYKGDWSRFTAWCKEVGIEPLPPNPANIAAYLAALGATHRMSTVQRALVSIIFHARQAGFDWETTKYLTEVLAGMRKRYGMERRKKAAATADVLRQMVGAFGSDLMGVRNRAILTLGWMAALRRSEVVALDVGDLRFVEQGLVIVLRKSKTDQEGRGLEKGIPYNSDMAVCAVESVRTWLAASGVRQKAVFRALTSTGTVRGGRLSDRSVAEIVKRAAEKAGLDPAIYSGHSLRAGFATTAAEQGHSVHEIMRQTGHKSERVAKEYVRYGSLFTNNVAKDLL